MYISVPLNNKLLPERMSNWFTKGNITDMSNIRIGMGHNHSTSATVCFIYTFAPSSNYLSDFKMIATQEKRFYKKTFAKPF